LLQISEENDWQGKAVTVLDTDGTVLGFIAMIDVDTPDDQKVVYVSYIVGERAKQMPILLTKATKAGIEFMHEHQKIDTILAEAREGAPTEWLKFLGFEQNDQGVFYHGSSFISRRS
jgi:putative heme iron utilization protein